MKRLRWTVPRTISLRWNRKGQWFRQRITCQQQTVSKDDIVLIALGGNALLRRGETMTSDQQLHNARVAGENVGGLIQKYKRCVVTHGNGPQVGMLASVMGSFVALDVLDAETEGSIGYMLEMEIGNAVGCEESRIMSVLTRVVVDTVHDDAFKRPTKPVGEVYTEEQAMKMKEEHGWDIAQDGKYWRRVVVSPRPKKVIESDAISLLLEHGVTVICCGGGGVPVEEYTDSNGRLQRRGVQGIVDKDASSSLLAHELGAAALLLLTDADCVYDPRRWPDAIAPLPSPIRANELRLMMDDFAAGSMRPKIEAACDFVEQGGTLAVIGRMEDAMDLIKGMKGTVIVP